LCRKDGWITASCAPWRDRPMRGHREMAPTTTLCSCQFADASDWLSGAYEQARKVSNPRPSVLETAAPPLARAQENRRMTVCAGEKHAGADGGAPATGERRSGRYSRLPDAPTASHRETYPAGTGRRRRSTGVYPGASFRRCVCVPWTPIVLIRHPVSTDYRRKNRLNGSPGPCIGFSRPSRGRRPRSGRTRSGPARPSRAPPRREDRRAASSR
jgi:hypothetical protein